MNLFLAAAAISGSGLISAVLWIIIVGLIFWLLWWLVGYINPPEPFAKILRVILAVAAVLFLINALLSMAGHPLVAW